MSVLRPPTSDGRKPATGRIRPELLSQALGGSSYRSLSFSYCAGSGGGQEAVIEAHRRPSRGALRRDSRRSQQPGPNAWSLTGGCEMRALIALSSLITRKIPAVSKSEVRGPMDCRAVATVEPSPSRNIPYRAFINSIAPPPWFYRPFELGHFSQNLESLRARGGPKARV